MKTLVLATSLFALTTGFAAAEVTLSGDARMGVISNFADDATTANQDESELSFTSRARVKFTLSGSTDSGLEFGASFRADNAAGASSGTAGSVFVSGSFGKLSMGDVDGASAAAIGQVDGVGLTGLGDLNEVTYFSNGGDYATVDPSALYEYSTGDLTIYASATNPSGFDVAYAIAAKYAMGDYTVSLAYESYDYTGGSDTQVLLGGSATFGAVTVKAIYGQSDFDTEQYAVSATLKQDALSATVFYTNDYSDGNLGGSSTYEAYGIGASYDLGGGASVVGGYSKNQTLDQDAYDLGVSMSF